MPNSVLVFKEDQSESWNLPHFPQVGLVAWVVLWEDGWGWPWDAWRDEGAHTLCTARCCRGSALYSSCTATPRASLNNNKRRREGEPKHNTHQVTKTRAWRMHDKHPRAMGSPEMVEGCSESSNPTGAALAKRGQSQLEHNTAWTSFTVVHRPHSQVDKEWLWGRRGS